MRAFPMSGTVQPLDSLSPSKSVWTASRTPCSRASALMRADWWMLIMFCQKTNCMVLFSSIGQVAVRMGPPMTAQKTAESPEPAAKTYPSAIMWTAKRARAACAGETGGEPARGTGV